MEHTKKYLKDNGLGFLIVSDDFSEKKIDWQYVNQESHQFGHRKDVNPKQLHRTFALRALSEETLIIIDDKEKASNVFGIEKELREISEELFVFSDFEVDTLTGEPIFHVAFGDLRQYICEKAGEDELEKICAGYKMKILFDLDVKKKILRDEREKFEALSEKLNGDKGKMTEVLIDGLYNAMLKDCPKNLIP